jgi:LacI family transcriptional regulator
MPTIKDVAERAGVSTATVSYVLNGTGSVAETTRRRVLAAVDALQYQPNHAARSLRTRSRTLGLVLPADGQRLADAPTAELVAGLTASAAATGYYLLLAGAAAGQSEADFGSQLARSGRVDGLVLLDLRLDDERVDRLVRQGVVLVCAGSLRAERPCSMVGLDFYQGARAATTHLTSLGHRRIGLIQLPSDLADSEAFAHGYADALAEAGLVEEPMLALEAGTARDDGIAAMQELLALPEPPTAVLAASDALAFGAMHALRDAGLEVGRDVALVGCGDVPLAAHVYPPLTTLRAPYRQLGEELARRLVQQIEQLAPPHKVLFGLQLIIRRTSAPPPTR